MNDSSQAWLQRAKAVYPAGGTGNTDATLIIDRGEASHVWDASGNEYIDYLIGSGPMLLGHGHPAVREAVKKQADRGLTFFAENAAGVQLAEEIIQAVACGEKIRYTTSGTEADFYAMRLARAFTGREKILKFEGGYHGMSDYGLQSIWPGLDAQLPQSHADSAGIPDSVSREVLVAPYNDLPACKALIEAFDNQIAGIIVEPMQRLLPPEPGFLEGLRALADEHGIVLIFDEVVTGFRLAYGGGQAYYGVTPDLATFGKVIGGGLPLAAVVGKADIMKHFDKALVGASGFLPMIGTLSGNPMASVAGLATLAALREENAYEVLAKNGQALMEGLNQTIKQFTLPAQISGEASLFDIVFTTSPLRNYRDFKQEDAQLKKRFNASLLAQGILKGESKLYISTSLSGTDIDKTIAGFHTAAKDVSPA